MKSLWNLLEVLDQERNKLFAKFRREFQITYGKQLEGQLFARYQKIFTEQPIEQLQYYLDQISGKAREDYRREQEYQARKERINVKDQQRALHTKKDTYMRFEDDAERVVCSDDDPGFEKTGMPCYHEDSGDPELEGYFAIHVGDARAWIPILMRDGHCDERYGYIYTIKTSELARTRTPFYSFGEDYHITDRTNTPFGEIIFSRLQKIPPQYIELEEVIDLKDVEPAPEPY